MHEGSIRQFGALVAPIAAAAMLQVADDTSGIAVIDLSPEP